ncbi:hypothetical protein E2C01_056144 [Portunus trituberculatus]|uniref:Uncharacterized protein n=1 Tax=Portunus trituberculatus TaxID=210409 RepID=A0A5B7GZK5_PORTR|nr:hypothetical protein [Portunus trituberculatus]
MRSGVDLHLRGDLTPPSSPRRNPASGRLACYILIHVHEIPSFDLRQQHQNETRYTKIKTEWTVTGGGGGDGLTD